MEFDKLVKIAWQVMMNGEGYSSIRKKIDKQSTVKNHRIYEKHFGGEEGGAQGLKNYLSDIMFTTCARESLEVQTSCS